MVVAAGIVAASQGSSFPAWVDWVSALAPFATLVAALVAGTIALLGLQQRRVADAKEEWWRRFAWASDLLLDARPERQEVGVRTLTLLARSELAHAEELEVVDAAWGGLLDAARPGDGQDGDGAPGPGQHAEEPQAQARRVPAPSHAHVLAARGRQETDARLHRATEPWVQELARQGSPPVTPQSHGPDATVTRR